MESLKEYVILALAASIIIAVFGTVVSDSMKGFIKFISGLIMIILFVSPLIGAINEFASSLTSIAEPINIEDDGSEKTDMTNGIVKEFKKRLEESAAETAANLLGIDINDVNVEAYIDDTVVSNIVIEKIEVKLNKQVDVGRSQTELKNIYHCDVVINTVNR